LDPERGLRATSSGTTPSPWSFTASTAPIAKYVVDVDSSALPPRESAAKAKERRSYAPLFSEISGI